MKQKTIDFGKDRIPTLFWKILIPTLLGMICMSLMTVIDGSFVGRGVGSDALAGVNIFTPLWLTIQGISLMLGIGCSVVASIHLSVHRLKAARISMTQNLWVGILLMGTFTVLVWIFREQTARLFGASDKLLPYVLEYQDYVSLCFIPIFLQSLGLLIIRLDGSPKYAMYCASLPAIINVVLDYVMLFIFGWGLKGVAIATAIGNWVGGLMVIFYLLFMTNYMRLHPLKCGWKETLFLMGDIRHQITLGFPALLAQLCIAVLMVAGNYVFMYYIGEDGVAAYSVACYVLPFIFMNGNAVSQSVQPIISYNYGAHNESRVYSANKLSLETSAAIGFIMTLMLIIAVRPIVGMFLDTQCHAFQLAVYGMPLLAIGFIPFILNIVIISNYQSVEKAQAATVFSLLRGFVLLLPCFFVLPILAGDTGIWLSIPITDYLTSLFILT